MTSVTSFDQFEAMAQKASVVAVTRTVPADLLTPLSAYLRLSDGAQHSFLLESVEGGEFLARYSFLGAEPEQVVVGRGQQTYVTRAGQTETFDSNAVEYLREYFRDRLLAEPDATAPMAGGAVGYLGYGASSWFDSAMHTVASPTDDAAFMIFRTVVAFDHVRQQAQIRSIADISDATRADATALRAAYDAALARIAHVVTKLSSPSSREVVTTTAAATGTFESNLSHDSFEDSVREIQELIAAGECYQAVLSQRFSCRTDADAVSIYRVLRATNPSPYMYLLAYGSEALIGASPEMLVRCRGEHLDYRPIAGTRPRGATAAEDDRLAAELLADEKERAEHVMLVDLGRNDLGRVARYGSVNARKLMKIEKYSHVQHIVTELEATLRPELDRFDALGACFPAGTVTGAPKIRAMQAIAELERSPRGVYSGSVLYADYAGNLDSCIAIRTIELRDGAAHVQAGAGIVADSQPASEFEETVNKSRALQNAVAIAGAGL